MKVQIHAQLFFCVITLFSLQIQQIASTIETINYGVRPVKPGDTTIKFYATAVHRGSKRDGAMAARLRMNRCCLKVPGGVDCNAMKLISGFATIFHPKDTADLEMYFVNFDLSDREGNCSLSLISKPVETGRGRTLRTLRHEGSDGAQWDSGKSLMIPFKTGVNDGGFFSKALSFIGWNSDDDDGGENSAKSRRELGDYKCLIRYNGARSIYNEETGHCDPTPKCSQNQMISPTTRRCEKIRDDIQDANYIRSTYTKEMRDVEKPWYAKFLAKYQKQEKVPKDQQFNQAPECVHGVETKGPDGKLQCTCISGWRSLTKEEYVLKGGALDPDGTAPITKLCNVQVSESGFPWTIFLVLFAIVVPVLVLMIWAKYTGVHESGDLKKSSSSSSENIGDEDEEGDHQEGSPHDSDDDGDKIISEIVCRREQKPKRNAQCLDPGTCIILSTATSSKGFQDLPLPQSVMSLKEVTSKISGVTQKQPPSTSATTKAIDSYTKFNPEPYSFSEHTEIQKLHIHLPSLTEEILSKNVTPTLDEKRNAARSPSTDELLTMKEREKKGAHIPMTPVSVPASRCSSGITVTSESDYYDSNNNNNNVKGSSRSRPLSFSSLSSEEITQRKKQQWDQFIESVSKEDLPTKKSRHMKLPVQSQNWSDSWMNAASRDENMNIVKSSRTDNRAMASRSMPQMKTSVSSPLTQPPPPEIRIPTPPESLIKKSLEQMRPEEYQGRQEALSLLQTLSTASMRSNKTVEKASTGVGFTSTSGWSWSSLASQSHSTTDQSSGVGSIFGPRIHSGDDDDLRSQSIYGNLGSDGDSDEALDHISNLSRSSSSAKRKQDLQKTPQSDDPRNPFKPKENEDTLQILESDCIPSDILSKSGNPSAFATPSPSSESFSGLNALNFQSWIRQGTGSRSTQNEQESGTTYSNSSLASTFGQGPSERRRSQETDSAYRIKSSLENALKASKSKSFTNFF